MIFLIPQCGTWLSWFITQTQTHTLQQEKNYLCRGLCTAGLLKLKASACNAAGLKYVWVCSKSKKPRRACVSGSWRRVCSRREREREMKVKEQKSWKKKEKKRRKRSVSADNNNQREKIACEECLTFNRKCEGFDLLSHIHMYLSHCVTARL